MIPASVALNRVGSVGEPLPRVEALSELHDGYFRWTARGGQTTMIMGQSGSQKSGLAVFIGAEWAKAGVTGLYMSADMDRHTATTRLAAAVTGHEIDKISASLDSGGQDYYAEALEVPLRFSFNPEPSLADIRREIDAWVETWDSYPGFVVVDNLLDVLADGDSEHSAYKAVLLDVKTLARETGAHFLVLHHSSEFWGDPTMPAPKKFLLGKVSQTPENVLSIAFNPNTSQIVTSLVKHRNGPSDASAGVVCRLDAKPSANTFSRHYSYAPSYTAGAYQ